MKLLPLSLFALSLFVAQSAFALKSDTEQPVYINSDSQQLDMKSNKVTFQGDVTLKQGSININADTITVTRDQKNNQIKEIEAFGKPATFSQLLDDGKNISGQANKLTYLISTDQLTMNENAELSQDGNIIKGSTIKYKIGQQKLTAGSSKNERVTTVLQPSQMNK